MLERQHQETADWEPPMPDHQGSPARYLSPGGGSFQDAPLCSATQVASPAAQSPQQAEQLPSTPAHTGTRIEFATPLTIDLNLDADDEEGVVHRYRTLDNILGSDAVPGLEHHVDMEAEFHNVRRAVTVEEPRSVRGRG